jgi:hypothetical protein
MATVRDRDVALVRRNVCGHEQESIETEPLEQTFDDRTVAIVKRVERPAVDA